MIIVLKGISAIRFPSNEQRRIHKKISLFSHKPTANLVTNLIFDVVYQCVCRYCVVVCVSEALYGRTLRTRQYGQTKKPKKRRPKKGPESRCTRRREVYSHKKCTYVDGSDTLSFNRDDAIENNITNNHHKQRTNHESHSS